MPKLGQKLAPAPSDIDEVRVLGAPQDVETPFDESMDAQYAGGFDKWTSPEARKAKANRVTHTAVQQITLYNYQGEDRSVAHEDLVILTDPALPLKMRLFVRCPKCERLDNRGIHPFGGPNGCPGKPAQKYMTCPICASRGVNKRVYETDALVANVDSSVEDDPNYEAPNLPDAASRRDMLQNRLDLHMTSFHSAESEQLYKIRREANGNSWRIVRG